MPNSRGWAGALESASSGQGALALFEESAALYRQLGDRLNLGTVLAWIGANYSQLGRFDEAQRALDEAEKLLSGSNFYVTRSRILESLGFLAYLKNDVMVARQYYHDAIGLAQPSRSLTRASMILVSLAELEFGAGNVGKAVEHGLAAAVGLAASGSKVSLGVALTNLAAYLLAQDDFREARAAATKALASLRDQHSRVLNWCLQRWALIAALERRHEAAARLLRGATDGEILQPTERVCDDRVRQLLDQALDAAERATLTAEGARWSEHDAVAFVTAELLPDPGAAP